MAAPICERLLGETAMLSRDEQLRLIERIAERLRSHEEAVSTRPRARSLPTPSTRAPRRNPLRGPI